MTTTRQPVPAVQENSPQDRRLVRHAALSGLILFVVSLATFAPEAVPDPGTASAAEVRRFATDNAGTIKVNTLAALACIVLFTTFVAVLAQQAGSVSSARVAPNVMLCMTGVIATASLFPIAVSSIFARPDLLADVTDRAVLSIYRLTAVTEWLYTLTILVPCMIVIAIYSWLSLRYRLLARWVSWVGLGVAAVGSLTAVGLMIPAVTFDSFPIALFGWWLWPAMVGGASAVRWWRTR